MAVAWPNLMDITNAKLLLRCRRRKPNTWPCPTWHVQTLALRHVDVLGCKTSYFCWDTPEEEFTWAFVTRQQRGVADRDGLNEFPCRGPGDAAPAIIESDDIPLGVQGGEVRKVGRRISKN